MHTYRCPLCDRPVTCKDWHCLGKHALEVCEACTFRSEYIKTLPKKDRREQ